MTHLRVHDGAMESEFEQLLRVRRDEVRDQLAHFDADLAQIRAGRSAADGDDEHDPEGSTLSADWSRASGLRTEALSLLDEIDAARQRLVDGTYGTCILCGQTIPAERLRIRPWAREHVTCPA